MNARLRLHLHIVWLLGLRSHADRAALVRTWRQIGNLSVGVKGDVRAPSH